MTAAWQPESSVLEKFLLGFEGTELRAELRSLLTAGLAGVAIFPRNFTSLAGLRSLTAKIRAAAGPPVLIGIDQEGGRRFSLPEPFTQWPSAAELGTLDDAELVEQVARAMARELRAVGCNLNFAPMLDLAINPDSPVTAQRSFGADPRQVARLGAAVIRGLAAEGVLACAKHFPGHGDTQVNPHTDLPVFEGTRERLQQIDLVPFAEAIHAGVPVMMTAHILLPQIDADRPASLSRKILAGLLRQELRFEGAVLADDLEMGALSRRRTPGDAAVETFLAGSDLALLCHEWAAVRPTLEAVERASRQGLFLEAEWKASHERIEHLRSLCSGGLQAATLPTPDLKIVGCAEHRALARAIRERIGMRRRV